MKEACEVGGGLEPTISVQPGGVAFAYNDVNR